MEHVTIFKECLAVELVVPTNIIDTMFRVPSCCTILFLNYVTVNCLEAIKLQANNISEHVLQNKERSSNAFILHI